MSYACPKNILGERDPPPKKERKRKKGGEEFEDLSDEEDKESDGGEDPKLDSLAAAIKFQVPFFFRYEMCFFPYKTVSKWDCFGRKKIFLYLNYTRLITKLSKIFRG